MGYNHLNSSVSFYHKNVNATLGWTMVCNRWSLLSILVMSLYNGMLVTLTFHSVHDLYFYQPQLRKHLSMSSYMQ